MASVALPPELAALAARQHGVLASFQLAAHLSERQIRHRCGAGAIAPLLGKTYLVVGSPRSSRATYLGAALAVPDSVVSYRSAAHVHGFPSFESCAPEVATRTRIGHQVPGVTIHRRDDLFERHRTIVDGIPVTTVPRTVLDLAAVVSIPELITLVDSLTATNRLSIRRLFDDFDRVARRGRNGTTAMRLVLEPRLAALTMDRTELEKRGLEFLRIHGFPPPDIEFRPPWAGPAVARVDLAWPEVRVVLELDSRRWHDRSDRFENDRLRDQLAMAHGWIVVRVTWRQLHDDAAGVADRLRAIMINRSVA